MADGTDRVVVRFLRAHLPYNAGEVAGFTPSVADNLLERGLAELAEPPAHPGKADGSTPSGDLRTHDLTIEGVGDLADTITEPAEIAALIDGEKAHPKHPGGRKGALEFLELRAAELAEPPA